VRKILALMAVGVAALTLIAANVANLESGPQVGDKVPGPFEPLHLTGPDAGEESCLFCKYGNDPVVMIFARTQSDGLTKLIAAADKAAEKHKDAELGAAVVYLDTSDPLKKSAKKLADDAKLKLTVLTCIKPADLEAYKIAADADVTVLLYDKRTVRANHAFKKGELTEKAVEKVLADLPKVLPTK